MTRMLRLVDGAGAGDSGPAPGEKPLRIAIATNDMENLNAHFGSARKFAIYEVWKTGARFVEAQEFSNATEQSGQHDDLEDRISAKVEALAGCSLLFALAIGGPSAARVVKAGVHPIKRKGPEPISEIVEQVRGMLSGNPPPFLRKILGTYRKPDFAEGYEGEDDV